MEYQEKLSPEECNDMNDIRSEIDGIDEAIVALLGRRFQYVKSAAKFKTSESSVRAPERFEAMLKKRREWALEQGLSPDVIEKMYRDLVNHFIHEEMQKWKQEPQMNSTSN